MKRTTITIISIFAAFLFLINFLYTRPQYSMLTGNKCINCHFSPAGGGQRDDLGWYFKKDVSLIKPEWLGIQDLVETLTAVNSYFDNKVWVGIDYRLQSARLGGPSGSHREYFGMQFTPYLTVTPADWLNVFAQYNIAKALYPGQQNLIFGAVLKPGYEYPQLRIGKIRPSIGVRYDDHTTLVRQALTKTHSFPLIPRDFAEYGAEINYESLNWLSISAGIYQSKNFSENFLNIGDNFYSLVNKNDPAMLFKVGFWPRFFEGMLNTHVGGSIYSSGDFYLLNFFAQAGFTDYISLLAEYAISDKKDLRKTNNFLIELSVQPIEAVVLATRVESAESEFLSGKLDNNDLKAMQYVLGAHIYLLPSIEFRPEYRIFDRDFVESYAAQWAFQLHFYY